MGTWTPGPGPTEGADTYTGIDGLDVANGLGGNDIIYGFGDVDQLNGGGGDDTIDGGAGADIIYGSSGNDTIYGGDDNDRIEAQTGDDVVHGGAGADALILDDGGADAIYGDEGDDAFYFSHQQYGGPALTGLLDGGAGWDTLTLYGQRIGAVTYNSIEVIYLNWLSSGMLTIDPGMLPTSGILICNDGRIAHATPGVTDLTGLAIYDSAASFWHRMEFWGSSGVDTFIYAPTSMLTLRADGGAGNDDIRGGAGDDELYGGAGADALDGGGGDDTLAGGAADSGDVLNGGSGDDVLIDSVRTTFVGGDGVDTADFSGTLGVYINLANQAANGGAAFGSTFDGVEAFVGGTSSNTMYGDANANIFRGGNGTDTLQGGDGNDHLYAVGGGDTLRGEGGNDHLYASLGSIYAIGAGLYDGGDGIDTLEFAATTSGIAIDLEDLNDNIVSIENVTAYGTVRGDAGANVLTGGVLEGRRGSDTLIGLSNNDTVTFSSSTEGVVVDLAAGTSWDGYETDTLISIENVEGTSFNDQITGNDADNTFIDRGGADIIIGGGGNDTLSYRDSSAGVSVDLHNQTASAGGQVDSIESIERVIGSLYDDMFVASAGDDYFDGVSGFDTVSYAYSGYGVTIDFTQYPLIWDGTSWDELWSIENVVGSAFDDVILGSSLDQANTYSGGAGDDVLQGGNGGDILDGGDGNDTAAYGQWAIIGGVVASLADPSSNTTYAAGDVYISIENLSGSESADTLTGDDAANRLAGLEGADALNGLGGNDALDGGAGADLLTGGDGNDVLDGGDGADAMTGNFGSDTYYVDNAGDTVSEGNIAGGTDTVFASVNFFLASTGYADHLTLTGTAVEGRGNALNNTITGNASANVLWGNGGDDTLLAGDGNDSMYGGDGADVLDGGTGADAMIGNFGDDSYYVDDAGDVVSEGNIAGGVDQVFASVSFFLGPTGYADHLTLIGSAVEGRGNLLANTITGNAVANALWGNGGDDTLVAGDGNDSLYGGDGADSLDGGTGADVMIGNFGNDTYYVDNAGDVVSEGNVAGGTDTVFASVSFNLGPTGFADHLTLTGASAINATGNSLANTLTGNSAANVLQGNAGNDTLDAGDGADTLYGGDGNDTLDGGTGADAMIGNAGNDAYYVDNAGDAVSEGSNVGGTDIVYASVSFNLAPTGFAENLTLTGSSAINATGNNLANTLTGNAAANTLTGAGGADSFVFASALGGGNVDAISDFSVAEDTIVLNNSVFTGLTTGALDANAFVIGGAASDADDRIIYDSATGQLFFDADGAGGADQILFTTLTAGLALTNADFIVSGP